MAQLVHAGVVQASSETWTPLGLRVCLAPILLPLHLQIAVCHVSNIQGFVDVCLCAALITAMASQQTYAYFEPRLSCHGNGIRCMHAVMQGLWSSMHTCTRQSTQVENYCAQNNLHYDTIRVAWAIFQTLQCRVPEPQLDSTDLRDDARYQAVLVAFYQGLASLDDRLGVLTDNEGNGITADNSLVCAFHVLSAMHLTNLLLLQVLSRRKPTSGTARHQNNVL